MVLSASFDPGWSVSMDGRPAATEMVAPALVAVTVPPGTHQIVFRYHGFAAYPELLALALLSLLALAMETGGIRLARAVRAAPIRQEAGNPGDAGTTGYE